ncbi:iron-containing alcohol dehydrogenase [Sorangium sp. So ce834]|uniref:3-dehydroquinate synthase family protein n=1 Tax=Sorangium sp. So ce834 TaxID=3133321 RepID=UPI003F637A5E
MPITIGHDVHDACIDHCIERGADRAFMVVDRRVWELYGRELQRRYGARIPIAWGTVEPQESLKTLASVNLLLDQAISAGLTRRSLVLAIGGGLTGNVAGMVAALLYRGVPLIHIPTTLLAMSDSILSLKQAVNGPRGKNLFGLYYLPTASFISLKFLETLHCRELASGVNELIKNCLVFDAQRTSDLLALAARADHADHWLELVVTGIEAKQMLLRSDPYEKHIGICLEYGHTVGHALECQSYGLSHGFAVGLGMLVSAAISAQRGMLTDEEYWLHFRLLGAVNDTLLFPDELDIETTIDVVRRDNKHGYLPAPPGYHPFVLLESVGRVATTHGHPLVLVEEDEIRSAIARARRDAAGWANSPRRREIGPR